MKHGFTAGEWTKCSLQDKPRPEHFCFILSRLPQAIYLYSSTLLVLSNGYCKSFTQQISIHLTIHTKGMGKKRIIGTRDTSAEQTKR